MAGLIAPVAAGLASLERVRQQATELEGVFLNTLMKEMFASLETEGDFGGGFAETTWRGMQAEQFADAMARAGGIGLADSLMADLLSVQQDVSNFSPVPPAGAYR
jgi:Rod binding domain-containing protein